MSETKIIDKIQIDDIEASILGATYHADNGSVSFGESNTAGTHAFATGQSTAQGNYSHAEGNSTQALGEASHAGGLGTIASAEAQTAIGSYNEENTSALFIVGNGDENTRSNAFIVNNDGSATLEKVGENDNNVAAVGYVKANISYVDESVAQKSQVQIITWGADD